MELFLIHLLREVKHSSLNLELDKLSNVGMKEFLSLQKVKKLFLIVHQIMLMVQKVLEMLFLLMLPCNFKLNF